MKKDIALFALATVAASAALSQEVTKYYDADWEETAQNKSTYHAVWTKTANGYACTSYYNAGKKLRGTGSYADTTWAKPLGTMKLYSKQGALQDSIVYDAKGNFKEQFRYYPNKQLEVHVTVPDGTGEPVVESFDEEGKKLKNYVFAKPAEPKGGQKGWNAFIQKNTDKGLFASDDKPMSVTVHIRFAVDEAGNVTKPTVVKSSGLKHVDQDALRIIGSAPAWEPAVYLNKPLKTFQTQPIVYQLQAAKK